MKGFSVSVFSVLFLVILFSCQEEVKGEDYLSSIKKDSRYVKQRQIGELVAKVRYKPISSILSVEIKNGIITTEKAIKQRKKELEGAYYYELILDVAGDELINITNWRVGDEAAKQQRLHYLNFLMKEDIKLQVEEEKLPCKIYHFERSYGISKGRKFLIGFKDGGKKGIDHTVIVNSKIFGTGPLKFRFDKDIIDDNQELKL